MLIVFEDGTNIVSASKNEIPDKNVGHFLSINGYAPFQELMVLVHAHILTYSLRSGCVKWPESLHINCSMYKRPEFLT